MDISRTEHTHNILYVCNISKTIMFVSQRLQNIEQGGGNMSTSLNIHHYRKSFGCQIQKGSLSCGFRHPNRIGFHISNDKPLLYLHSS